MIALRILKQKSLMSKLLTSVLFDAFLLEEAVIDTYNTFTIDGHIHKDFYKDIASDTEEIPSEDFSSWEKIRPIALELIKGKQTPLGIKFVLHASKEMKEMILSKADSRLLQDQIVLALRISLSQGCLIITTGMSSNVFSLDKSIEKAWDEFIPSFLESNGIETELL